MSALARMEECLRQARREGEAAVGEVNPAYWWDVRHLVGSIQAVRARLGEIRGGVGAEADQESASGDDDVLRHLRMARRELEAARDLLPAYDVGLAQFVRRETELVGERIRKLEAALGATPPQPPAA